MRRIRIFLVALALTCAALTARTKWYKFDKQFIEKNFPPDSAIGELHASGFSTASRIHSISCGGKDGELHVGIAANAILRANATGFPVSSLAEGSNEAFGVVAEPPNATGPLRKQLAEGAGGPIVFQGYYRVWNEGHDVGPVFPSNPHHVLELHPAWAFRIGSSDSGGPSTVFSMNGYRGYGAKKFRPVLESVQEDEWPKVAADGNFVYVELRKAENFYQLPVRVKSSKAVSGGKEFVVDVHSSAQGALVYSDLAVIVADGTEIATELRTDQRTFLLGLFSVNLRKAMAAAAAAGSLDSPVFAPSTLEFFAFGVPKHRAVASCQSH